MRHLRPRYTNTLPFVLVGVVLVSGGGAFWFGLQAFRAHAEGRVREDISEALVEVSEVLDVQAIPAIATLRSPLGDVGRATRVFTEGSATIDVLVALPALDILSTEYRVWLVKNGLADVVDIGALTLRADGTWAGVFTAGPVTGVVDPALYSEIVIMVEEKDGNPAPSGVKACAGVW